MNTDRSICVHPRKSVVLLFAVMRVAMLLVSIVGISLCPTYASAQTITAECIPAEEHLKAADLAAQQNDWVKASNRYWTAVQIAPSCVEAMINLGVVYN